MPQIEVTEIFQCDICNTLHKSGKNTFFQIYGNVTIDKGGGIIGNNFDEKTGEVKRTFVFCNSAQCITRFIKMIDVDQNMQYVRIEYPKEK